MIKSVKGQFVLSLLVAISFIYLSFSNIEFTGEERFTINQILFYFIMITSVFNAGLMTQKYLQFKEDK
ncbi:hypothetical protein SAMN04487944_1355 [Gracilibacillus ureilyticus]|uniref:Uncharacterized protein n=1 Tax=Gracilibacillus ureilyticus TaxID=531814 RepID=A0A1H9W3T2_9BACI|nr:hypothetical protein [Gracilibacillus ureilyticus]SES28528.1 hypothetical protein SAMN04487944_1355 [Gracilibacillus ureilyticus]